jgi:hypothetical protein
VQFRHELQWDVIVHFLPELRSTLFRPAAAAAASKYVTVQAKKLVSTEPAKLA